ncbi:flagellar filament capping protein FliD [Cohnella sp. WQ 127256]|uniref:flagellar filament capping protein FliD n=1 Tax=Cohnella sp. WQ 127256 TaxID=2938790 RepID=UPI0021184D78|nr:flagellar filament capping protein FliD [Cohnella sp. WQ 127256]
MVTRIAGLNSGVDIESMVSKLMAAERMPLDKIKQKKMTLSWQTDLYREVNTKLASFKTTLDNMRLSGDWKLSSGKSSNENAVTVSADGTANNANHSILITSLATGATTNSSGAVSKNSVLAGAAPATTITAGVNDQFNVTLGGVTRKITLAAGGPLDATSLAAAIQTQVNNAFGTNKLAVSSNAGNLEFKSIDDASIAGTYEPTVVLGAVVGNTGLADLGFTDKQSNRINLDATLGSISSQFNTELNFGDFMINGKTFTYSATDTLRSIMNNVNNSDVGVTMNFDSVSDKFTFSTKDTGSTAVINLQAGSGNFLAAANLSAASVAGTDANVTIDGVQSYRNSNTFISNGVTYNLKQTTAIAVSVSVSKDIESTVNKVKDFVTKYNEMLDILNQRVKEAKFRSYTPLTDAQKKDMEESEIKIWEEKAKSGLLRNDDILKSGISEFRNIVISSVGSASSDYNALFKVGISTKPYDSKNPQDAGKLVIDETELRKALTEDPANVAAVFSNQPDGIAQKMYEQANKTMDALVKKAGGAGVPVESASTDIGLLIGKLNQRIADFDVKLSKKETNYYKMFSTMDTAIGKSNSVLAWLNQQ